MAQPGIRTDDSSGFLRLGVAGHEVAVQRERIAAILRNRIGEPAANLLAVADTEGAGKGVCWRAENGASLTPVSGLSPERARALHARRQELVAEIEALASRLGTEGDAGRLAGHLLRLALVTPDGCQSLHAAGDQPVLVNWGHAAKGQAVPEMDETSPRPAATVSVVGEASPPPAPAAPSTGPAEAFADAPGSASGKPGERRRGAAWVAWVLPLILLCVLSGLLWCLWQPLAPVVVEQDMPVPPPDDPVPAARERLAALRLELAAAQAMRAELMALCAPVPERRSDPVESEPRPGTGPVPETATFEPPVTPFPLKPDKSPVTPFPPKPDEPPVAPFPPEPDEPPVTPFPPEPDEPPVMLVEPEPAPETAPQIRPRPPLDLPSEVPHVSELPLRVGQRSLPGGSAPTLCEPDWTPTRRPEVMVVIDGSGSMKEGFPGASSRIDAAKDAVSRIVRSLHGDITIGLVSFTHCDETSTPRKYDYGERPELLSRVRGTSPSRGTSLANSIRRAGNAAKSVGPVTVVVVSDGEDSCGGDPCGVARALKTRKPLLKINALDLSGRRSAVLQCLADVTGGRVFVPRDAEQMSREMQEATGQPDASRCNP